MAVLFVLPKFTPAEDEAALAELLRVTEAVDIVTYSHFSFVAFQMAGLIRVAMLTIHVCALLYGRHK